MRMDCAVLLVALGVAGSTTGSAFRSDPPQAVESRGTAEVTLDESWPATRVESYRMAGKIRPLLFWIGRDPVGTGRIVWRRGPSGETAYELLIGTDPALAPRQVNRWGYIAEEVDGTSGRVLGVISKSEEGAARDVRAGLGDSGARHAFSVIRGITREGQNDASTWTHVTPENLSLHDLNSVLNAVRDVPEEAAHHRHVLTDGVRSGFLAAVAELIDRSLQSHRTSASTVETLRHVPVPYVHGDSIHDLTLRSHERTRRIVNEQLVAMVVGKFQTRKRLTGDATRFEVIYGLDGCLAGIPISIKYQPRWWLRVELLREPGTETPVSVAPDAPPSAQDGDCR